MKQGHKKIVFFFSQPETHVTIATKEQIYTDATINLEFRLIKCIFLIKGKLENTAQAFVIPVKFVADMQYLHPTTLVARHCFSSV